MLGRANMSGTRDSGPHVHRPSNGGQKTRKKTSITAKTETLITPASSNIIRWHSLAVIV